MLSFDFVIKNITKSDLLFRLFTFTLFTNHHEIQLKTKNAVIKDLNVRIITLVTDHEIQLKIKGNELREAENKYLALDL